MDAVNIYKKKKFLKTIIDKVYKMLIIFFKPYHNCIISDSNNINWGPI
jgi:hypothetical protein